MNEGGAPPRRRRRNLLVRAGRSAIQKPLLATAVTLPTMLLSLLVIVGTMLLLVRAIGAKAGECDEAQAAVPVAAGEYAGSSEAPGPGTPPQNFIPAYFAASNQEDAQLGSFGPYVLMGIHNVESNFGRSNLAGVKAGANFLGCCKGPFQFYDKPGVWSTWLAKSPVSGKTYARDGDGDGKADIYSNVDSMFAAAALLFASGAPADWKKALFSYNRSTAYGEQVLAKARSFEQTVKPPGGAQAPAPAPGATQGSTTSVADTSQAPACGVDPGQLVAAADGGPYSPPLPQGSYVIKTKFWEWRGTYNHKGTDLAAPEGTPFRAIGDGKVSIAGPYDPGGYGTYICIEHTQRLKSCYGHPSRVDVKVGDTVKRGQVIGLVGAEGDSTGPHLHFELYIDGAPQCPANYVGIKPALWCESNAPGFGAKPQ